MLAHGHPSRRVNDFYLLSYLRCKDRTEGPGLSRPGSSRGKTGRVTWVRLDDDVG